MKYELIGLTNERTNTCPPYTHLLHKLHSVPSRNSEADLLIWKFPKSCHTVSFTALGVLVWIIQALWSSMHEFDVLEAVKFYIKALYSVVSPIIYGLLKPLNGTQIIQFYLISNTNIQSLVFSGPTSRDLMCTFLVVNFLLIFHTLLYGKLD